MKKFTLYDNISLFFLYLEKNKFKFFIFFKKNDLSLLLFIYSLF